MTVETQGKIKTYSSSLLMGNTYFSLDNPATKDVYNEIMLNNELKAGIESALDALGYHFIHNTNIRVMYVERDENFNTMHKKSTMKLMETKVALALCIKYFNDIKLQSSNCGYIAWEDLLDLLHITSPSERKMAIDAVWILKDRNIIACKNNKSELERKDANKLIKIHIYSAITAFLNTDNLSDVNNKLDIYMKGNETNETV